MAASTSTVLTCDGCGAAFGPTLGQTAHVRLVAHREAGWLKCYIGINHSADGWGDFCPVCAERRAADEAIRRYRAAIARRGRGGGHG